MQGDCIALLSFSRQTFLDDLSEEDKDIASASTEAFGLHLLLYLASSHLPCTPLKGTSIRVADQVHGSDLVMVCGK